ncbi:uncharacterized protein LOC126061401 [Elephas maximus indicus]|uniref:uncharacterized protein LOC126061401 n=1 Tax=Elephas maximus indicus TaxID=99487 RepID=UPI002115F319|nr:uncharacterized protein LOC126061401 [Elephas maximus indicus]
MRSLVPEAQAGLQYALGLPSTDCGKQQVSAPRTATFPCFSFFFARHLGAPTLPPAQVGMCSPVGGLRPRNPASWTSWNVWAPSWGLKLPTAKKSDRQLGTDFPQCKSRKEFLMKRRRAFFVLCVVSVDFSSSRCTPGCQHLEVCAPLPAQGTGVSAVQVSGSSKRRCGSRLCFQGPTHPSKSPEFPVCKGVLLPTPRENSEGDSSSVRGTEEDEPQRGGAEGCPPDSRLRRGTPPPPRGSGSLQEGRGVLRGI